MSFLKIWPPITTNGKVMSAQITCFYIFNLSHSRVLITTKPLIYPIVSSKHETNENLEFMFFCR